MWRTRSTGVPELQRDDRGASTEGPSVKASRPDSERTGFAPPPPEPGSSAQLASGLNVIAGIWLFLAPFALGYRDTSGNAMWNDLIIGASVVVLALMRVMSPRATAELSWVNFVLGAWLVVAPLVLNYNDARVTVAPTLNDIILGLIILALAGWSASAGRRDREADAS